MYPTECILPTLYSDMICVFKVHKVVNMSVSVSKLSFYIDVFSPNQPEPEHTFYQTSIPVLKCEVRKVCYILSF